MAVPVVNKALPLVQSFRFEKSDLALLYWQYTAIYDCLNRKVKDKREIYLPYPNPDDTSSPSKEAEARYTSYLARAVFYEVAGRTLAGLVGQVFANDPEILLPDCLKPLEQNVNGKGTSLLQFGKETLEETLAYGRSGLYVDYPKLPVPATAAQLKSGKIKPSISLYKSQNIINWKLIPVEGSQKLVLVVLREWVPLMIDSFQERIIDQYRVLKLTDISDTEIPNWVYTVEVWGRDAIGAQTYSYQIPVDFNGQPFDSIQFEFIGSNDNGPEPDQPPLYPLVELNLGHYRNSADYEESCFVVGQPTFVVSGLTEDWLKTILKNEIRVGSRNAIPLPVGAKADLLQVQPNTMPFEAMAHKEKQMVAIGAKLIEDRRVQKTATEANIHNAAETSILSTTAKNVSVALQAALERASYYVSDVDENIIFKINTDFSILRLTAAERQELILEWQTGAISFTEMRSALRSSGIAIDEDSVAKPEIVKDAALRAQLIAASQVPSPTVGNTQSSGA